MHALQRTCLLLALLLSTTALSETGLQSGAMANEDGPQQLQYKERQPTPASAPLIDTGSVNAVVGQQAALECRFRSQEESILWSWKAETQTEYPCLISFSHDRNATFVNCGEHITWTPPRNGSATLHVNPVGIIDDGLYIFETSNPTEGSFSCCINLEVQVPPEVTLITDSSGAAVCQASGGKPAANISWEPECEYCITEKLSHLNQTVTVTSKYKARSENETAAVCIVSHPTFLVPRKQSSALSHQVTGGRNTYIIWLSVTVFLIITALIIGFIFYRKPRQLRQCYKFTCQQETSLQRDQHNAEVVEEVEPYASYMQKVNTIYCSITELAPEYMPDGSQIDLRNDPRKHWN